MLILNTLIPIDLKSFFATVKPSHPPRHVVKQKETSQFFSFCYLKYSLFKVMQFYRDKPWWSYQYASQQDTGAAFKITFTASN
jgi:hypothetical protein